MIRVLIVEDEKAIAELVAFVVRAEGYEALIAGTVKQATDLLLGGAIDLILLDMMLPDMSGLVWLSHLRRQKNTAQIPIIMLTARSEERDRVAGLDAGADDYIVKPFLPRELTARIRAVLRRKEGGFTAPSDKDVVVTCGPLSMNDSRFEATVNGQALKLSAKEFRLLFLFASRPGRVFSRAQLLELVWGDSFVDERTVDVHMLRLRKQLANTALADLLETVRGLGYRMKEPNE